MSVSNRFCRSVCSAITTCCRLHTRTHPHAHAHVHTHTHTITTSHKPVLPLQLHQSIRSFSTELHRRQRRDALLQLDRLQHTNPLDVNICIIGQPNTGKSTLYNRLIGKNLALVNERAGVTRDRSECIGSLHELKYNVIDTAGLDTLHDIQLDFLQTNKSTQQHTGTCALAHNRPLQKQLQYDILQQTRIAIQKSQIILFVIDSRDGCTERDRLFAAWLRKQLHSHNQQHIICIANKAELHASNLTDMQSAVDDALILGFGDPIPISAQHNYGIQELYQRLQSIYHNMFTAEQLQCLHATVSIDTDRIDPIKYVKLAIAGKPNVGKSSLINAIIGENRCLTGSQPGITRDSQSIVWSSDTDPHCITLVDTAGLKGSTILQRSRFSKVDTLAMQHSLQSIDMSNVTCLVIDAATHLNTSTINSTRTINYNSTDDQQLIHQLVSNIITADDLSIARHALEQGRALLLIANKFDLIPRHQRQAVVYGLQSILHNILSQGKNVPIIPTSTISQCNIDKIRNAVLLQYDRWNTRISTGQLNTWLRKTVSQKPHPTIQSKSVKLKYITQIKTRPPTFAVFCNRDKLITDEYQRFLINTLRDEYNLAGVPVRLLFRTSDNPFLSRGRPSNSMNSSTNDNITTVNASKLLGSQKQKQFS